MSPTKTFQVHRFPTGCLLLRSCSTIANSYVEVMLLPVLTKSRELALLLYFSPPSTSSSTFPYSIRHSLHLPITPRSSPPASSCSCCRPSSSLFGLPCSPVPVASSTRYTCACIHSFCPHFSPPISLVPFFCFRFSESRSMRACAHIPILQVDRPPSYHRSVRAKTRPAHFANCQRCTPAPCEHMNALEMS